MYYAIVIEQKNKPTATLCNKAFMNDARSAAGSKGVPGVRVVSETVPAGCSVSKEIEAGVTEAMDNIVATLTRPLTAEEISPQPRKVERTSKIILCTRRFVFSEVDECQAVGFIESHIKSKAHIQF